MIEEYTRHQIYIQRLAAGMRNRTIAELRLTRDELLRRISEGTDFQQKRIRSMLTDINDIIDYRVSKWGEKLTKELEAFAIYEAEFATKLLESAATVIAAGVSPEQVIASITDEKMRFVTGENLTIKQAIDVFSKKYKDTVESTLRGGLVTGATTAEITRDIRRVVNTRTASQAEALILTSANHVGGVARGAVWKENSDLIDAEEYHATLDSRTTLICASLDGQIKPIGELPTPPLHYRCRSLLLPVIKEEYRIGAEGSRSAEGGTVSAKTTYAQWLKRQSASVQDEVLGKTRGKLYRKGNLSIDRFIDKTGRVYTLDELRQLDSSIFNQ